MKRRKLLAKLDRFLAQPNDRAAGQRSAMRKVLAALKSKERKLEQKIADAEDSETREKLATELAICCAQRRKGVERLRGLQVEKRRNKK